MEFIVLASSSPRRKALINLLEMPFIVVSKEVDEQIDRTQSPEENVKALALKKAMAVAEDYPSQLVIGCDTVVAIGSQIIGKPRDKQDAKVILDSLSGKSHFVYTGVAIVCKIDKYTHTFCERTSVKMKGLTAEEIDSYIRTGEPLDKAGAYGIQGKGALYIEGIEGDYYNVVGLPVHRLYQELTQINKYYEAKKQVES
ncbi:MAG: maf protein [Clostridia bacterium]|jgi:septum formation protein|nr:maf protein [Clostridia bacterium]